MGILNILNGRISPDEVNVDRALKIGETTMTTFELYWPTDFNAAISKDRGQDDAVDDETRR